METKEGAVQDARVIMENHYNWVDALDVEHSSIVNLAGSRLFTICMVCSYHKYYHGLIRMRFVTVVLVL